jgi:hypothetical protein
MEDFFEPSEEVASLPDVLDEPREQKRGRGRPTAVEDSDLFSARSHLLSLFAHFWAEVEWPLHRIKKPEDVRPALRALDSQQSSAPAVESLLRETSKRCSPKALFALERKLGGVAQEIRKTAERKQHCEKRWERVKNISGADLTTDQIAIVEEQQRKRSTALERALADYSIQLKQYTDLQHDIKDCRAYLAQAELAQFITGHRYAINPVNISGALAGWPRLQYRQSIKRCNRLQKLQPNLFAKLRVGKSSHGLQYWMVAVLRQIINSREEKTTLVSHAESWLRSARFQQSDSRHNAVVEMQRNWYYLRHAIRTVVKTKPVRRELPNKTVAEYFQRLMARTDLDSFFAEDEQIVP